MKIIRSIVLVAVASILSAGLFAQNDFTAYSLSNWNREGTARSVAMGNAFTALGGDLGSIGINPASSAVYKFSEIGITPALNFTKTTSDLFGESYTSKSGTLGIANAGGVFNFKTGLFNGLTGFSFGIVLNKSQNFNSRERAIKSNNMSDPTFVEYLTDFTADNINPVFANQMDITDLGGSPYSSYGAALWPSILGWNTSLINLNDAGNAFVPTEQKSLRQAFRRKTFGYNSETALSFGFNIEDRLFFGVNVNLMSVWNKTNIIYSEDANEAGDFNYMDYIYNQKTTGSGIGGKFGLIYTPNSNIRIGAAISTPTYYFLSDKAFWSMGASMGTDYVMNLSTPDIEMDYKVISPFTYNVGFAVTFPEGAISIDYEGTDFSQMKLKDDGGFGHVSFSDINKVIKDSYKRADKVRVGAEINATTNFALRAGFQYSNSGIKDLKLDRYIGSLGIGYQDREGFFADLGFSHTLKKTDILLDGSDLASSFVVGGANKKYGKHLWNILLTFGFRF